MIRRPGAASRSAHGRTLSEARTPAILRAALSILQEVGYDRLTMDAVASRARAGKATLYRRWADKAELVAEAVTALRGDCAPLPPDTGSLRSDLAAVAELITTRRSTQEMCVMSGLAAALPHDRRLAAVFQRMFLDRRTADMVELFRRAQRRGEIPLEQDVEFLGHLIPSMVFARSLVSTGPVDRDYLERLIDTVVIPAVTATHTPTDPHTTGPNTAGTEEAHARQSGPDGQA